MSRPSDEDFRWMAGAALREEATRARVAEVEKGAKLREAEAIINQSIAALGGDYAPEQVPEAIKQAFALMETVERERDVMRAHCRSLVRVLLVLAPYPPEVAAGALAVVDGARAALGEEP